MAKPTRYPKPRASSRLLPRNDVPDRAVELAEDIVRLDMVLKLLLQINPLNIGNTFTQTQRDSNRRFVRTTTAVIRGWQRTARHTLASEYLAP